MCYLESRPGFVVKKESETTLRTLGFLMVLLAVTALEAETFVFCFYFF
jgi:hypothetical protein